MLLRVLLPLFVTILFFPPPVVSAPSPPCTWPDTRRSYTGDGEGLHDVYKDLVACANITDLSLQFQWGGCVAPSDPWLFDFKDGDTFPALKKLSLMDYDLLDNGRWRSDNWMWKESWQYWTQNHLGRIMPSLAPNDSPPREPNLDKWLQAMDFSQIQDLSLDQKESIFFERMEDKLPSLKTLSVHWQYTGPSVSPERMTFLQHVPPLESLKVEIRAPYGNNLTRTAIPLQAIVDRHCPGLRSLSVHQTESRDPTSRRPMLSLSDIDSIANSCPSLAHLGFDIDRNASTSWPNATLDAVMRLQNLTTLDVGLEIGKDLHASNEWGEYYYNPEGLNGQGPFREPRMSLEGAETLFEELKGKKEGCDLEEVRFVVGDVPEVPYSGPLYFPSWDEGRERTFVCRADYVAADGGGGRCRCLECDHNHDMFDENDMYM